MPAGRIAIVASVPASASTQRCTMPSPPQTNTRSAPSVDRALAPASAPSCSSAPRTRAGRRRLARASTSRSSPSPPPSDFPECATTATEVTRSPPGERATATARTHHEQRDEPGTRNRAARRSRRRSGSACRGTAARPATNSGASDRDDPRDRPHDGIADACRHDQREPDVEHDGGGRVPRREARRRWRVVEPHDRRARTVDEERRSSRTP